MKSSLRTRLLLAALLAASLGAKAALSRAAPGDGGADVSATTARLLKDQGYAISIEDRPFSRIVHARRGACRLLAAEYLAHGTIAEPLAALAAPIGPLRFVWRDVVSDAPPKLLPLAHFYVRRELRRAGIAADHLPILAFAASAACPEHPVDWAALAALPP